MGQPSHAPDPNGRGRKARAASRAATKLLTEAQFHQQMRVSQGAVDELHEISRGVVRRNSATTVNATRTILEWGYARPKQETELSGNVTITVASPLPGRIGSGREAKVLPVATSEPQVLCLQQGPITANMSTAESVENPTLLEVGNDYVAPRVSAFDRRFPIVDAMLAPSVIEAGRLTSQPDERTPEQRRHDDREAWRAEQDAQRNGCGDA